MSSFKRVKAALIGCGVISRTYFKNLTTKFHVIELIGCADIIPEKARLCADEFGLKAMTVEEIYNDPSIEIVINTTFPLAHYNVTKAALLAGKNVYTEKMMAVEYSLGEELVKLSNDKGLLFTTAPDTFLGGGWQTVRNIIDIGWIGKPVGVNAICIRSYEDYGSVYSKTKHFVFGYGSGIPFDMGGYYMHAMINLLGPISRVTGFAQIREPIRKYTNPRHPKFGETFELDSTNSMTATLEFKNGTLANLLITSASFGFEKPVFEIYGTEGALILFDPNDFSGEIKLRRNTMSEYNIISSIFPYNDDNRGIGVADMAYALLENRKPRVDASLGLHALEAMHGVVGCAKDNLTHIMKTTVERPEPLPLIHADGETYENILRS
ncbi:Gfo/Idh/MocA family protein [Leadbettera azotonutricia]|uniref:Dehydrogenase n=1 Tax=Leadbettera azotonutricia (strain ATCC BAA-888 / DSM 13862 / ZAS-9) TaxID=545695 RepID=F5Y892_LEAAZ|nr:Gfo/Idh/MocA family oxidoreductase [Leadbettera azotonutricia]AEF82061.1 dehydrogenase [Leadbettera azotonutricia ZAS-9]